MSDQDSSALVFKNSYFNGAFSRHSSVKHSRLKKSLRLHRASVPVPENPTPQIFTRSINVEHRERQEEFLNVEYSPVISRFSSTPAEEPSSFEFDNSAESVQTPAYVTPVDFDLTEQDKKNSLIHQALTSATDQPQLVNDFERKNKNPLLKFSIMTAIMFLSFGGFFLYSNINNLTVQVASEKAGIDVRVPEYNPAGYELSGPVAYSEGEVTLNFAKGEVLGETFSLTQSVATETADDIAARFFTSKDSSYRTVDIAGVDLYLYDNNTAAEWIDQDINHKINSTGQLSLEDITKIVNSL